MTKNALIYAWTINTIGFAVLFRAALECRSSWQSSNGPTFLVCLALAALAATFKVKLPKLTGTISPAFVFLLVSVATLSRSETVAIAVVSGIVQCLWRPRTRPSALQLTFNAAALAISGAVAHGVTRGLVVVGGADSFAVVLGAAGVALLVTDTVVVSTILCLIQEAPFYTVWRSVQFWAVPYYLAGGVLASVWTRVEFTANVGVTILAAVSVYVLSVCCQELGSWIRRVDERATCAIP